jgi:hypothetical protein
VSWVDAQLIATGAYDLDWASVVFPEPTAQLTTTLEQTAAGTGLPETWPLACLGPCHGVPAWRWLPLGGE